MNGFSFKQFTICHDRCAMKVGTDGVLLGAWAEIEAGTAVLDVGTGTGLIAIMAAQRGAEKVVGIEINPDAVRQARENVSASPWPDRVEIVEGDVRTYAGTMQFDTVVSNPPFFTETTQSPDGSRAAARHTSSLDYGGLVESSLRFLKPEGSLQVVLPFSVADSFLAVCALAELKLVYRTDVVTKEGVPPKRTLMRLVRDRQRTLHQESFPMVERTRRDRLVLYDGKHEKTADYRALTDDFYLH